ncbi:basic blue protein-like [Phalaenopsis equestris]|uniref:basic blue protein-like n=1 Tax=Phalaenopsis equestris TaxID=78828 RepID=UPI0009E323A7|nr:basic blue protein-like [Phalaenopsis equestris]
MAQRRGSAGQAISLGLAILSLMLLHSQLAESAVYTVGDKNGWTFNTAAWPNAKGSRFRAGDVLVFKYNRMLHNVVAVNAAGYNGCAAKGGKIYKTGNDRIALARGPNYFICSIPGHCEGGMKLLVNAA